MRLGLGAGTCPSQVSGTIPKFGRAGAPYHFRTTGSVSALSTSPVWSRSRSRRRTTLMRIVLRKRHVVPARGGARGVGTAGEEPRSDEHDAPDPSATSPSRSGAGLLTGAMRNWVQVGRAMTAPCSQRWRKAILPRGHFNLRTTPPTGGGTRARGWDNRPTAHFRCRSDLWFGFTACSPRHDVLTPSA